MTDHLPLVTIRCITYNHEPYIRECLEGFVMQQTNFKFEAIVHDDASTDGTAAIIAEFAEKYPDIIKPLYETENQYSKRDGSIRRIMNAHTRGKYIAICEGDDYWTDPLKLQKQVDFLEANPEYGCVYTAYKTVDVNSVDVESKSSMRHMKASFSGDIFWRLMLHNFPQTLTILYRRNLNNDIYDKCPIKFDYPLFFALAIQQKFHYLDEVTGAYRINPSGAIRTGAIKMNTMDEVRLYYVSLYYTSDEYKRSFVGNIKIYWGVANILSSSNVFINYKSHLLKVIRRNPIVIIMMIPALPCKLIQSIAYRLGY